MLLLSMAGVAVLITSGFFSYPLSVLPLNGLFWLLIAQGSRFMTSPASAINQPVTWLKKGLAMVLIVIAIFITHFTIRRANALYEWGWYKKMLAQKKLPARYSACLHPLYPILADNSYYMISLGKALTNDSNYAKAIGILLSAKKITPSKEVYYTLGKAYQRTGQFQKAEIQYNFVLHAIPNLLKPSYLLTKLYFENKKWSEFKAMASKVSTFEQKFPTNEAEQIKEEVYYLISISPYNK
jgi:tetratricopeptide (TPR) repeat protein